MTDVVKEQLTDFGQLYRRYKDKELIAQQLLQSQHYYLKDLSFDPVNGEALSQRMSNWLNKNTREFEGDKLHDRFTHLIEHCVDAIGNILISPRQTVVRVHEMTPVYLAQRLDSRSVQWLSRKPGDNMREKLATNPNILAATRKMSLDTLENRLLKTLLKRLEGGLLYRQEAGFVLSEKQDGLLISIKKTLRLEEFAAIKPWQHMPPNNVLLQDKQYGKVWRAWRLLQCLESDCQCQQQEFKVSGFGLFSALLKQVSNVTQCVILDQAWHFKLDCMSVQSGGEFSEAHSPVEVETIELGVEDSERHAQINPNAKLTFILSEEGHIKITRSCNSTGTRIWHLDFQLSDGVIYVSLSSDSKSDNRVNMLPALPANYPTLIKRLLNELFSGERKMQPAAEAPLAVTSDFITLMFDGASCKVLLDKGICERGVGPLFFDYQGLDCSQSRALEFDAEVFSAQELTMVNQDDKNRQISTLSAELASQLKPILGMHYLVRDHHSDFETYELRREVNRNFKNATPLSKSISSVFSTLTRHQFKRDDLILVLDSDLEGVYATPVYYRWGKKPGDEYLERHPSIKLSCQGEKCLLQNALEGTGLPQNVAERFIDLYSYSEIVTNKAKLVLKQDEHWYRIPSGLKVSTVDVCDTLMKEVRQLSKKDEKIYFISVSPAIKQQKGIKPTQWLTSDLLLGSQQLIKLQHQHPHKIFWKDHLPQLMTRLPVNGIEQDFFFVDGRTSIKPERGISIPIDIEQMFTLPSDKEELRFTVYQGSGSNRQAFSLSLSLRQALKIECVCELTLTYTYGDEQPYKLRFTPATTSNRPFHYVDAKWGKKESIGETRTLAVPAFPVRLAFEKLRSYSNRDGDNRDLVHWMELNFEQLGEIYQFILFGKNKKRFNFAYRDIKWIPNKDFGFYESHADYKSIFVHQDQFKEFDTTIEEYFSGDVNSKGDRYSLVNVRLQGELSIYEHQNLSKKWRFPMITFSDQSRSFDDQDIPMSFAEKGKQAIKQAQEILNVLNGNNVVLQRELQQFLCYCHKLMPKATVEQLLQTVIDKKQLRREAAWFMYALGDIEQTWQRQLLELILNPADDGEGTRGATLEILSVAMWRDSSAIHQLTKKQILSLTTRLQDHLLVRSSKLSKEDDNRKWNSFIQQLELLLALIRTRESSDPAIKSIFALDSQLTNQLLNTVEKITDKQGEMLTHKLKQHKINARVKLAIDKPESYHRTPDLLYALKLYLSGKDGADQITITELVNNE